MNLILTNQDLPTSHHFNVVSQLLQGSTLIDDDAVLTPAAERCVSALERRAPETVRRARNDGLDIEYLGTTGLFAVPRFYEGVNTDWVLARADRPEDKIAPRRVIDELRSGLVKAGIDRAVIYIAHELDRQFTTDLRAEAAAGRREIAPDRAAELIGPVPPPPDAVALGQHLGERSAQVIEAGRRTLQIAGATVRTAVAVPTTLVAGAVASAATLDPILLAAWPAISERPGAPASWFVLARWDW
jgi:hypothetical protein